MLKALIASSAVVGSAVLASPALADVYVNPEFNGGAYGEDWLGGTLNLDVGFEGGSGAYSYYIQGGPAVVMPDGEDQEFELAGKLGGSVVVSPNASVYAELSGMTGDELSVGTKLGMKYSF